jgi:hypothetical protein
MKEPEFAENAINRMINGTHGSNAISAMQSAKRRIADVIATREG